MMFDLEDITEITQDLVQEVLESIQKRDLTALGNHKLSNLLVVHIRLDPLLVSVNLHKGEKLREVFAELIEASQPFMSLPDLNRDDWRSYYALKENILEHKTPTEVAEKLGLGVTRFYYYKNKATEELTYQLQVKEAAARNSRPQPLTNINFSVTPYSTQFIDRPGNDEQGLVMNIIQLLTSRSGIVALEGPGGIGKSVIAWEVAKICFERRLFTAIIWTTAKQEELISPATKVPVRESVGSLDGILITICKTIGYRRILSLNNEDLRTFTLLSLQEDRPVLLIIDDLESLNIQTVQDIREFIASLPRNISVLLTTRERMSGSGEYLVEIPGLDKESAGKFIRLEAENRLRMDVSSHEIEKIYELTAGNPLTMQVLLSLMKSRGYDSSAALWDDLNPKNLFPYLFQIIYDEKLDSNSRLLLHILAVLEAPVTLVELAAASQLSVEQVGQSAGILYYHFLIIQEDRKRETHNPIIYYGISAIERAYLQRSIAIQQPTLREDIYERLSHYYFETLKDSPLHDQVVFCQIVEKQNIFNTIEANYEMHNWQQVLDLAKVFTHAFGELGYIHIRQTWGQWAKSAATYLGKNFEFAWHEIHDEAYAWFLINDLKRAEPVFREAVEKCEFPSVKAIAQRNLAYIVFDDNPIYAVSLVTESLAHWKEMVDPQAPFWTAITLRLLGIFYSKLGKYQDAIPLIEDALHLLHSNRFSLTQEAITYSELALAYARCNDYHSARTNFENSKLLIDENQLEGGNARYHLNLAEMHYLREDIVQAGIDAQKALEQFNRLGVLFWANQTRKLIDKLEGRISK